MTTGRIEIINRITVYIQEREIPILG